MNFAASMGPRDKGLCNDERLPRLAVRGGRAMNWLKVAWLYLRGYRWHTSSRWTREGEIVFSRIMVSRWFRSAGRGGMPPPLEGVA